MSSHNSVIDGNYKSLFFKLSSFADFVFEIFGTKFIQIGMN